MLSHWLTRLRTRPARNAALRSGRVLSAERMQFLLIRERSRSDRSSLPFCLIAFELESGQDLDAAVDLLIDVLHEQLRISDDIGLLDDGRLAALLPDTPLEGGELVAERVTRRCREAKVGLSTTLFVYPYDDHGPWAEDRDSASEAALTEAEVKAQDAIEVEAMTRWFVRPLPLWKRAIDVVGAAAGLTLCSPLIVGGGLLHRFYSPGPIFFWQWRDGIGGQRFLMVKLRTMDVDAEARKADLRKISEQDGPAFKLRHDPRVTFMGKLLRKTSLDELPQFWNVLKGDMSLVGPRPLPCDESRGCARWQRRRLDVTPGLTCIWQVEGRSRVSFAEWIRMDLRYIRQRSLWYDLSLMVKTVPAVVGRKGAH